MSDFPKIECPYIREIFDVDITTFKQHGKQYQLREPKVQLVINKINPGYEWVFDEPDTIAVEKLHGTNIKIKTENGRIVAVQNRLNVIDPLKIIGGKSFIVDGILRSAAKELIQTDGEQAGELIGVKVNGNPYKMGEHLWYPFSKAIDALRYKSFNEHERTFNNLSLWFKDFLRSRFDAKRILKLGVNDNPVFAEGVIFYNLKRKAEGKTYMAKLRRDMFDWFYAPDIEIFGYANS